MNFNNLIIKLKFIDHESMFKINSFKFLLKFQKTVENILNIISIIVFIIVN